MRPPPYSGSLSAQHHHWASALRAAAHGWESDADAFGAYAGIPAYLTAAAQRARIAASAHERRADEIMPPDPEHEREAAS